MPRLSKIGAAALAAFGWTGGASVTASALVVAGGGSGAKDVVNGTATGGGGAGEVISASSVSLNPTLSYTITVGAGGASQTSGRTNGNAGSNSSLGSLIIANGGGYGACYFNVGGSGGSGGGGSGDAGTGSGGKAGGSSTTGTLGGGTHYGNAGGTGSTSAEGCGGGGGAGAVGANGSGNNSGAGGAGTANSITGSSVTYAGGGGGGGFSGTAGAGGSGGGGAGGASGANGTNGTANLGGGGGGAGSAVGSVGNSGSGGSGVVIISYPAPQQFGGGVVTTSGSNVIHTFNTSGTLSPLSSLTASYLIVAGGGAGGVNQGGGGGAGGLLSGSGLTIDTNSNYVVVVGAGATQTGVNSTTANGSNSSFSMVSTVALGGGGAGGYTTAGASGGSGGGGGGANGSASSYAGGAGTSGQGFAGGTGTQAGVYTAGGGGGSSAVGANSTASVGGNGGAGTASSISGTSVTYAGGGGGGVYAPSGQTPGSGGAGGGGAGGGTTGAVAGTNGTAGLGGGGGGGAGSGGLGGNGGSGVVIISYAGSTQQMAGGTVTITGGNVIHTFTSSGYLTPIKYVNNSLRFRSSASAYLNRTPSVASSSSKYTVSMWVKLGAIQDEFLFGAGSSTANQTYIRFYSGGSQAILWETDTSSTTNWAVQTNAVYRDPSAWYHLVFAYDSSLSGLSNQAKIYVNGVQTSVTTSGSGTNSYVNTTVAHYIGRAASATYFDGYITEAQLIDGQALTPNSFGTVNSYGVWQPITYGGSYGTNGFYLPFSNTTSATTLAYDFSPNGNNWTPNNISTTAGATYDSMTDVPTLTSATAANYCVGNPLDNSGTLSSGNLTFVSGGSNQSNRATFQLPSSDKFYAECTLGTTTSGSVGEAFGYATASASLTGTPSSSGKYVIYADSVGYIYSNGSTLTSSLGTFASGTVLQIAYDGTTGNAWVGKNNTWYNSSGGTTGDPSTGANPTFTSLSSVFPFTQGVNGTQYLNFGQQPWVYTPPTGFVALNTYNL